MTSSLITDEVVEDACFAWIQSLFPAKADDEEIRSRITDNDREHIRYVLEGALPVVLASLRSSAPPVMGMEEMVAEAVAELKLWRMLVNEGGVPRYTVTPGAALNTVVTSTDRIIRKIDAALSTPLVTGRE